MLTKSGLMDQAQSWIGTGENKPVSGEQIAQALPGDTLREVAAQAGVSPQEAADQIAQHLPQAVDKLTPSGELPQPGRLPGGPHQAAVALRRAPFRARRPSRQAGAAHSRVAA